MRPLATSLQAQIIVDGRTFAVSSAPNMTESELLNYRAHLLNQVSSRLPPDMAAADGVKIQPAASVLEMISFQPRFA